MTGPVPIQKVKVFKSSLDAPTAPTRTEKRVQFIDPLFSELGSGKFLYEKWRDDLFDAEKRVADIKSNTKNASDAFGNLNINSPVRTRQDAIEAYKSAAQGIKTLPTELETIGGAYDNAVSNLNLVSAAEMSEEDRTKNLKKLETASANAKQLASIATSAVVEMKSWAEDLNWWAAKKTARGKWETVIAEKNTVVEQAKIASDKYIALISTYDVIIANYNKALINLNLDPTQTVKDKGTEATNHLSAINSAVTDALAAKKAFDAALESVPDWYPVRQKTQQSLENVVAEAVAPLGIKNITASKLSSSPFKTDIQDKASSYSVKVQEIVDAFDNWATVVAHKDAVVKQAGIVSTNYDALKKSYDDAVPSNTAKFAKDKASESGGLLDKINSAAAVALTEKTAFEEALASVPDWFKKNQQQSLKKVVADAVEPLQQDQTTLNPTSPASYDQKLQELGGALTKLETVLAARKKAWDYLGTKSANLGKMQDLRDEGKTNFETVRAVQRWLTKTQRKYITDNFAIPAQALLEESKVIVSEIQGLETGVKAITFPVGFNYKAWSTNDPDISKNPFVVDTYTESGLVFELQSYSTNYEAADADRLTAKQTLLDLINEANDRLENITRVAILGDVNDQMFEGTRDEYRKLITLLTKKLNEVTKNLNDMKTKYKSSIDNIATLKAEPRGWSDIKLNNKQLSNLQDEMGSSIWNNMSNVEISITGWTSPSNAPGTLQQMLGLYSIPNMKKIADDDNLWKTIDARVSKMQTTRKQLISKRADAIQADIDNGGATAYRAFGGNDVAYDQPGGKLSPDDPPPIIFSKVEIEKIKFPYKPSTFTYKQEKRRPRVFLGVADLDSDQYDMVVSPEKGWSFVSQNIDAIWMNFAQLPKLNKKTKEDTNRFTCCMEAMFWPGLVVRATKAQNVVMVQNIGVDKNGIARPSKNAATNMLKTMSNVDPMYEGRYVNIGVVGSSIVTDYVCKDDDCTNEVWSLEYIQDVKDYYKTRLSSYELPNMSVPLWPSTRVNWWFDPGNAALYGPRDEFQSIVNASDGVVLELAPINFLPNHQDNDNIGKKARASNALAAMKNCVLWCRANGKPVVWLAPKGSTDAYLDTMQQTWALFENNACQPDAVVVINYKPGQNSSFSFGPEREGTASTNTLTGVARWLLSGS